MFSERPHPSQDSWDVIVRCWTSRSPGAPCSRHKVTVHADWTIQTPHDSDAERVAAALGGYSSCSEWPRSIPAVRHWFDLERRAVPPPLRFRFARRWHTNPRAACCPEVGFPTAPKAAEHARSPKHLATQFGAPERHIEDLTTAIRKAYEGTLELSIDPVLADAAAHGLTGGRRDVTDLWYAGVHPHRVTDIRDQLGVSGRLPARFYLGVIGRGTDLAWMAQTLGAVGNAADQVELVAKAAGVPLDGPAAEPVASWLAWTHAAWDTRDPTARGRWLAAGVTRTIILRLGAAGYDPDDVLALARGLGREPDGAARHLERWLTAGLHPDVDDLIRLHESGHGPHWYVPSGAAVARLRDELGADVAATDTELAFVIAVAGTVQDAVAAIRNGTTLW